MSMSGQPGSPSRMAAPTDPTVTVDTAHWEDDHLTCPAALRRKGQNYAPGGVGRTLYLLRRSKESLIYLIETHWTVTCGAHTGIERTSHRFVKEK
jgi:hypothetical protein